MKSKLPLIVVPFIAIFCVFSIYLISYIKHFHEKEWWCAPTLFVFSFVIVISAVGSFVFIVAGPPSFSNETKDKENV